MVKTNEQLQKAFNLLKASESGLEGEGEKERMKHVLGALKKLINKRGGNSKALLDHPGSEHLKEGYSFMVKVAAMKLDEKQKTSATNCVNNLKKLVKKKCSAPEAMEKECENALAGAESAQAALAKLSGSPIFASSKETGSYICVMGSIKSLIKKLQTPV